MKLAVAIFCFSAMVVEIGWCAYVARRDRDKHYYVSPWPHFALAIATAGLLGCAWLFYAVAGN